MGMFKGSFWQVLNKFTWSGVNSVLGNVVAQGFNLFGGVDEVSSFRGALALSGATEDGKAITIGHYSLGPDGYKADWRDNLFVHEYGHYIQSQMWGLAFLPAIGIPSLASAGFISGVLGPQHRFRWFEVNASKLGAEYFDRRYGSKAEGYQKGNNNYFDIDFFVNGAKGINLINAPYSYKVKGHPIHNPSYTIWDFIVL